MKKLLLLLIGLLSVGSVFSQKQNVSVYVTGDNNVDKSILQVISSELVTGFAADERYSAVERTDDFLNSIKQEQDYQNSGNVDDSQICKWGKQFGADLVCVVNVLPFKNEYYCNARLINVQSATVVSSVRETSLLNSLDDVVLLSDKLVYTLTGKKTQELKKQEEQQRLAVQQKKEAEKKMQQELLNEKIEEFGDVLGESVVNIVHSVQAAKNPYYYLKVCNLRSHTRKLYIDGTYLGEIPSGQTVRFKVPLSLWHTIILVQKNGYLFQASKETFTRNSQPLSGQELTLTDN